MRSPANVVPLYVFCVRARHAVSLTAGNLLNRGPAELARRQIYETAQPVDRAMLAEVTIKLKGVFHD